MSGRIVGEVLDHAPEDLTLAELQRLISLRRRATQIERWTFHQEGHSERWSRIWSIAYDIDMYIRQRWSG